MARFVDSHCHLQHEAFSEDRGAVLSRALDGLDWIVVVGDDVASSLAAAALAGQHSNRVYATAGIHPHHAAGASAVDLDAVRQLLREPQVVALGEIGLDYHYEFSPREQQRALFRAQLDLAAEVGAPVVVHCREAEDDVGDLVDGVAGRLAGGVMHCFGGDTAFARRCLAWGFCISFAGNVTFPKAKVLHEAAGATPLDRLLLETDSPYLAPQAVRGKRCEPLHVLHTAGYVAALKGVELEDLAQTTTDNARRLFLSV